MKRMILIAVTALAIPASMAAASELSTMTIGDRVAEGRMTIQSVNNFAAGSGLDFADIQGLTLPEAAVLVDRVSGDTNSRSRNANAGNGPDLVNTVDDVLSGDFSSF